MRPQYSIVTPPQTEPITYDQAAAHLRVDSADDIEYITDLISVAREYVDSVTGRASGVTEWKVVAPCWHDLTGCYRGTEIQLFRTPLVSVESISYYAPDDDELTVLDDADYLAITAAEPGMIKLTGSLPSVDTRPDAIEIIFTAGYSEPALVPAILRHAVKMLVGHLYENRLPVAFASCSEIPYSLQALISNQKIGGWVA